MLLFWEFAVHGCGGTHTEQNTAFALYCFEPGLVTAINLGLYNIEINLYSG